MNRSRKLSKELEADQELADIYVSALDRKFAGDPQLLEEATNHIIGRLDLPLDETEQGLTKWAAMQVEEFVELHRTKGR